MNIRGERPLGRTEELILAFSLDELDAAGQRELYELLTGPEGQAHAKEAWAILRQCGDLRSTLPNAFAQTVASRLAAAQNGTSVMDPVMRGIGQVQARLPEIPLHVPQAQSFWGLWKIAFVVLLVLALCVGGWYLASRQQEPQVRVLEIQGSVQDAGQALCLGSAPMGRMISLAVKSKLALQWADGSQASIQGSASVQVQQHGFSLRGGRAEIHAVEACSVGLPDCSLEIDPGSKLLLDASRLGALTVLHGRVTVHRGNLHSIIPAGNAGDGWRVYLALDQPLVSAQPLQVPKHPCRWSLWMQCANAPLKVLHPQGDLELRENTLWGLPEGPQTLVPASRRQFHFEADALGATLHCEPGGQILQFHWTTPPSMVVGSNLTGRCVVGVSSQERNTRIDSEGSQ